MKKIKGRRLTLEVKRGMYGYVFIIPLIVGIACFLLPNLVMTIVYSLSNVENVKTIDAATGLDIITGYKLDFQGFAHYQEALFKDKQFFWLMLVTVLQLFADIPVIVIFSLFIAAVLNQKFRGRIFARMIFFIPVLLATGIIFKMENVKEAGYTIAERMNDRSLQTGTTMDSLQMINMSNLLSAINLPKGLTNVIISAADSIYRVVQSSGIQIFIFLAGLQEIPESLYEAAKVEGCSGWELFWKITIPMISPLIIVNSVYTIVDTYTKFGNPMVEYIDRIMNQTNQYGLQASMYVIYFVCLAALLAIAGFVMNFIVSRKD